MNNTSDNRNQNESPTQRGSGVDLRRLVRDSFPSDPHEEQVHAIQGDLNAEFIEEAAKEGWQWVAASYHGIRFMFLPNSHRANP